MAFMIQKSLLLLIIALSHITSIHSQQNLETHYPFPPPPPQPLPPPPLFTSHPPPIYSPPPPYLLPLPLQPPPPPESSNDNSNKALATAVAVTAASTFAISGLVFFLVVRRRTMAQRRKAQVAGDGGPSPPPPPPVVVSREDFSRFEGNVKGIIVDENGLDVLYWRKLNSSKSQKHRSSYRRETMKRSKEEEDGSEENRFVNQNRIQEVPLLQGESSNSAQKIHPEEEARSSGGPKPNPPSLHPPINPKPPETVTFAAVPGRKSDSPPPAPPPPPPAAKAPPPPLPPPPKIGGSGAILKPPPTPVNVGASSSGDGQVKLKPLHWDKVNINNPEQSMVWNKIERGSFKVDDDLMEALFGYVATNRKNPSPGNKSPLNGGNLSPGQSGQIFILEMRKSQNIAIILKSLAVSRKEILDALTEGQGLTVETLEKLNRITPTKEEESEILNFTGDPTKLADAESFLFHILRAVPSAFTRFNAMLFKLNYESEILSLKASIDTVSDGCKELRTRGLFMKLLEAVLKAGNRMNAGTSRGNAQAFNLNALKKLADVKSTDGKTTLLHFVVEEVVRSEGRKCVRSKSVNSDNPEKEYMMLGLPIVGGLSQEFSNVKKAATIDYDSFSGHCSVLGSRVSEIRDLLSRSSDDDGLGFGTEMLGFLKRAESELSELRRQQNSVVELAKSTIEYYQGCTFKEKGSNPLHLFVIIRDFLNMVDQVCVEIARNVQKKKIVVAEMGSSTRKTMRFPKLPPDFMSNESNPDSP